MKSTETISIKAVKHEAKLLYRGRMGLAIKVNIIPIILTIITTISFILTIYTIFAQMRNGVVADTDTNDNFSKMFSIIQNILSDAIEMMLIWGTCWTLIDWYENPRAKPVAKSVFQIIRKGNLGHTLILVIVQSILQFLWTLLFVIPGVIKSFSYSQTYFIYKIDIENGKQQRQLTDYITISRRIMDGRKWELFLLELSFIGWHVLGIITLGLAYIYVVPYLNATRVAYSRHLLTLTLAERQVD